MSETSERAAIRAEVLAEVLAEEAAKRAERAKLEAELDVIVGPCDAVLRELDELGTLTEPGARLYFAVERYLFPDSEAFRPESLAATEQRYLKRAGL